MDKIEMTDVLDVLKYIHTTLLWEKDDNFLNKEFGCHETGTNLETQTTYHACHGCNSTGISKWDDNWKVQFTHERDCKFIKLQELLSQFD
jgi:hypothetical protein